MKVNYKGRDNDFNYRVAEIYFDDEKESELMDKISFDMNKKGYEIDIVTNGYAVCEVEDKDEYSQFVKEYKVSKRLCKYLDKIARTA